LSQVSIPAPQTPQARVLSGSFILLTGSGLVTAVNFAYNIAVARFLGPNAFGDASAVYTLLILISAVTLSFQIVSAKVVAQQESPEMKAAAYRGFHKSAWRAGILIAVFFLVFRGVISSYLNLHGTLLITWLALGIAFYVPLGSRRGYLQGACGFKQLASSMVLEGLVRLFGSLIMIMLGYDVVGVIAANSVAVAVAYLAAAPKLPAVSTQSIHIPDAFREAMQAIVFFVGQVVINNCDIVVVKHFFAPTSAGLYAAIALVGRVVFAFSWAVINTMFPIVAGTRLHERKNHAVLVTSLSLVFGIGATISPVLRLGPAWIWTSLFGAQFSIAGPHGLPFLLALYAATAGLYSLSVVMIAYEMAYKIANTSWLQLAFSVVLIASIYRYHSSLEQVIWVQMVMMLFLFAAVAAPFLWKVFSGNREITLDTLPSDEIRTIRRVTEDEVIAEFLHNDFQNQEFEEYRSSLSSLVSKPNFLNADENAKRRALLFIRHGSLWRELPRTTEWFEVAIREQDLTKIRMFPRAHWRKIARGNYAIQQISKSIASGRAKGVVDEVFLAKIEDLRKHLPKESNPGAVLLIGMTEAGPFTVLDGNHRLMAATLTPGTMGKLRFYCGLSPDMINCCWYKTNFSTLIRYGTNRIRHGVHDPASDLERLLEN
jgi:O-antigen/teichoic acid export membrane protein